MDEITQRRQQKLATDLAERLRKAGPHGQVVAELDTDRLADGVGIATWRAAARQAGRHLGWKITTHVDDHRVLLVDARDEADLTVAERNLVTIRRHTLVDQLGTTLTYEELTRRHPSRQPPF